MTVMAVKAKKQNRVRETRKDRIVSARIGIAADTTEQEERDHLILEELVGALGDQSSVLDHCPVHHPLSPLADPHRLGFRSGRRPPGQSPDLAGGFLPDGI